MKLKKILAAALTAALTITALCSCSKTAPEDNGKLNVVTTIFPAYDFTRQIAGENINLTMLLKAGTESHTYEPSPQDIITIQNADLFIYTGGEGDTWVDGILSSMDTPVPTLKMMDCVNAVEEELVEGMQGEAESEEHSDEPEYDEHVWTSPKNAVLISEKISEKLQELDSANKDSYKAAALEYSKKLNALDKEFSDVVASSAHKTLVFGDRFPMRYFADAYGLDYYAAFVGCSSETEPAASTLAFLVNKVNELQIPVVFYIEFSTGKVAQTIASQTGCETALFNSCHNVSLEDMDAGATYISLMEQNVELLKKALN